MWYISSHGQKRLTPEFEETGVKTLCVCSDLFLETCLYMIFFGRSLPAAVVEHILENFDVYFTTESQGQSMCQ